jgi:hypothetical protein
MNLDLRIPMGLMFIFVGVILTAFGLATMGSPMYDRSLGINANLDWGVVLLAFGLIMFIFGRRGQKRDLLKPAEPEPQDGVRRGH